MAIVVKHGLSIHAINHQLPFQLENGNIVDKIIFFISRKDLVIGLGRRLARSIIELGPEITRVFLFYN